MRRHHTKDEAPRVADQLITDQYSIYCGDSCEVIKGIPDQSLGFSVFSPPFADLYCYTDSDRDLGNCRSYEEFFEHFNFLAEELSRVMMPGRSVAIHCMDLPTHKSKGEDIGLKDFPGDIIRLFMSHGFVYASRFCIWKDPLLAATRTKAIGLAHKQIVKDSSICRTGIPDYIVVMRNKGENPRPIKHPKGLTEYAGERQVPLHLSRFEDWKETKTNKRSHWIWQQYASPVWDDIRQTKVLPYKPAKTKDDGKHICPLQLQTIERCLTLWSNKGDIVFTPFMGIGSEVYCAVKMKRKAIGIELKRSYYRQACKNMASLDTKQGNLFDEDGDE